jgi:hypothetical protein
MSRPVRIPERGDVAPEAIARLMGLSLAEFEQLRPELDRRGLPSPSKRFGLKAQRG